MPNQLENARRLARLGFSIIPLDSPADPIANDRKQAGKVPAVKWAPFQVARATDDNLQAWFANGKQRNVGIVTGKVSGLVIVDTDTPEAEEWAAAHLPATPIRTITAKGVHRGYRHPGKTVPNKARIRDGVDVRGDGGYVVAPGSVHASGHVYRAAEPWPDTLDQVPVFDLAWVGVTAPRASFSSAPVRAPSVLPDREQLLTRARAYVAKVPGAIEGQGGDTHTFQLACKLVRGFGLDASDAGALLRTWNARCVPAWSELELDAKIESALKHGTEPFGARAADRPFVETPRTDEDFPLSDTGNAEAFAAWYGDQVRFDHRRKRWFVWGPHRFLPDADAAVERLAKDTIRRRQAHAFATADPDRRKAALKWSLASESKQRRDAMLMLARTEHPIAEAGARWDRDPWLLGVANGVVDLRTGSLRAGHPDDRITMAAAVPYDRAAACPLWERVVADIFAGDAGLVAYTQRALGYSLTGITAEQCVFVPHGPGSNGKGTLLNTVRAIAGDYGSQMPFATVLSSRNDAATNDLAALDGRRFVLASEANDGVRFDEARLKALSGCDPISARFLYAEFFEFVPVAKFWLSVNHKPVVRDDSHAFWRRIRLLPFERTFAVNPTLADDLKAEAPGILAWAVRGCLLWQAEGLGTPTAVLEATAAYRRDSDAIGDFLAEACALDAEAEVPAAELYRAYVAWADRQGLADRERLTQTMFGRKVSERFRKTHTRDGARYHGVAVNAAGGFC